jgi:class 3 adenylate cyclase
MPEDAVSARPPETRKLAAIMFTDIVGFNAYPDNPDLIQ